MNRIVKKISVLLLALSGAAYAISFAWPIYEWNMTVPSPDSRYDVVVLKGEVSAFSDFSYRIYVFPHNALPAGGSRSSRVWNTPVWRGTKYLVYSGDNSPAFRWTSTRTLEIDINEAYPQPFDLQPIKVFDESKDTVLVSVLFNQTNQANIQP